MYDKFKEEDRQMLELDFGDAPEKIEKRLFRHI